jgi:hypothetical protein
MTERYQIARPLSGHNARYSRNAQNVAFRRHTCLQQGDSMRSQSHKPVRDSEAFGLQFGPDINHVRSTLSVEMR